MEAECENILIMNHEVRRQGSDVERGQGSKAGQPSRKLRLAQMIHQNILYEPLTLAFFPLLAFLLTAPRKGKSAGSPSKDKMWFPLPGPFLKGRVHTANRTVNMLLSPLHPLLGAPDTS